MTYPFDFFTEYGQFYLCDKTSPLQTDSENFWTDQALEDNLAIEEGVIGIASEGHGRVKGEIKILPEVGEIDSTEGYDHIVEGSIAITSGIVQVLNCPDSALQLEFELNPGFYRVSFRNDDAFLYLDKLVDEDEKVWFIASEPDYKHWVYESRVKAIQKLIGNTYYFEYYIVSRKYEWLICENHHGLLMGIGEKAKERIRTLADDFADQITFTTEKQNKNTGI